MKLNVVAVLLVLALSAAMAFAGEGAPIPCHPNGNCDPPIIHHPGPTPTK